MGLSPNANSTAPPAGGFGCEILKAPPLILAYKHRRFLNFSLRSRLGGT